MNKKNNHLPKALTDSFNPCLSRFQTYKNQVHFDLYKTIKAANSPQVEEIRTNTPAFESEFIEIRSRG